MRLLLASDARRGIGSRAFGASLLFLIVFVFASPPIAAQIPGLEAPKASLPTRVKRSGLVETTAVNFEGLPLFTVAAPLVEDHSKPGTGIPIEERAQDVENRLQKLLETLAAADRGKSEADKTPLETGDDDIVIVTANGQKALVVQGRHITPARELVRVTTLDAEQEQKSQDELAQEWRTKITRELSDAIRERRPDAIKDRAQSLGAVGGIVLVVIAALLGLGHLLFRHQERLRKAIDEHSAAEVETEAKRSTRATATDVEQAETPEQQDAWWRFHQTVSLENQFRVLAFFR